MGSGFRTWAAGEVATASNVNNYLQKQAVMAFASSAARDAAITAPEEGMFTYQIDADTYTMYTGAAWLAVASGKTWTTFTPTWTGSVSNPVLGNGTCVGAYLQVGKTVRFKIVLTVGSTTTFGSGAYGLSLAVAPNDSFAAAAVYIDASASTRCSGSAWLTSGSGVFRMLPPTDAASAGISPTVPFTFATSDQILVSGIYETA